MKIYKFISSAVLVLLILMSSSCSIKKDDLEGAKIYTTVYPINYLTEYLYGDYAEIASIYPSDCNIKEYSLTSKQIKEYSKSDLFIYNGLTNEKELAKEFINKNRKMLIIDVSNGLTLENDVTELWLSPNNYLMLAKNIKNNLQEYITSKYINEEINKNYKDFEEKISLIDASLHTLGKSSSENGNNIIVASNSSFKYLNKYGFEVVALDDPANLKDNKLKAIQNNFQSKKYKYILLADVDSENEVIINLVNNYKAKTINVDTLTMSLSKDNDYFEIMTNYIENLKNAIS